MTSPNTSLFAAVEMAPKDPILGLTETYLADSRPNKVNLGVGVYYDDNGKLPLLRAVKKAEESRIAKGLARGYQPIDGPAAYNKAVQALLFGESSPELTSGRVVTMDTLGGTGGLKVGADYLRRLIPSSNVLISDPTWENHRGCSKMRASKLEPIPTTTRRPTDLISAEWSKALKVCRTEASSCSTPAAITRPA